MSNTKIWAISIIGLLCGWFLLQASPSLMPVLWALFLAYFIHPMVLWLQKRLKTNNKIIATAISLVLIAVVLMILFNIILPPIINQTMAFLREFTEYSSRFMILVDQLET